MEEIVIPLVVHTAEESIVYLSDMVSANRHLEVNQHDGIPMTDLSMGGGGDKHRDEYFASNSSPRCILAFYLRQVRTARWDSDATTCYSTAKCHRSESVPVIVHPPRLRMCAQSQSHLQLRHIICYEGTSGDHTASDGNTSCVTQKAIETEVLTGYPLIV